MCIIEESYNYPKKREEEKHVTEAQKLVKIMNEKISKRRIQITDLQKQEIEEKEETNKLITLKMKVNN